MAHRYRIDTDKGFITHTYKGDVYIEDWEDLYLKSISDPKYCTAFNYLTDVRDCRFKSSLEDVKGFAELVSQSPVQYDLIKQAIVANTPNETHIAVSYKEFTKAFRAIEVFSDLEAAVEWLTN